MVKSKKSPRIPSLNIGAELLRSVKEMKTRKKGRVTRVKVSWIVELRLKTGLSQTLFAKLLGVSPRTLQDWEQGRRQPSGAAKSLLKIAQKYPEALVELAA
ncbi:MAG: helix-turn-helix domain-containing protein [Gammaproteobacteria bacterium]|nr:helix-turn-helix domain-containing protein [Gammaproteobacteria bacterium]